MNFDQINQIDVLCNRNDAITSILISHHGSNPDHDILNDDVMCALFEQIAVNNAEIKRISDAVFDATHKRGNQS